MTDQQKLTKITLKPLVNYPDATISYEREHRDAPEVVTIRFDSSDFEMTRHYDAEASHAEPEMGLAEVLREAMSHMMRQLADPYRDPAIDYGDVITVLEAECARLDADSQQRERDVRVGTVVRGAIASCIRFPDDELIGRIAREAVAKESS